MKHLPLITVVIPLYNGAQYIRRSVQSVLEQSYTDFELVVVDDGSVDRGDDIALEFTDPRLRLVRQENMGVSAARNKGIAESRGKYIAFLDADDEWDALFLDAVVNLTTIYPQTGIYGTGYRMVYPEGPAVEVTAAEARNQQTSVLITDYFFRASGGNLINASGVMIPRRIFKEIGDFRVGEHHGEDLEMWARIALHYPIGYDTRILFCFYQTALNNKPRSRKLPRYDPKVKTLQEALTESSGFLVNKEVIRSHVKNHLIKTCLSFIVTNNRSAALAYMQGSNAAVWAPLLNTLINVPLLWPFLWFVSWMYRFARSRVVRKLLGGQRVLHGVLERVVDVDKKAWDDGWH